MTAQEPIPGTDPDPTPADLFQLSTEPKPWALGELPRELQGDVIVQIGRFIDHLNHVYAVDEAELIPACWPEHPGLVLELAAVWAAWVEATLSIAATPTKAVEWHQVTLRRLYAGLRNQLGRGNDVCSPAGHREGWCPAADRWGEIGVQEDRRKADPRSTVRRGLGLVWPRP